MVLLEQQEQPLNQELLPKVYKLVLAKPVSQKPSNPDKSATVKIIAPPFQDKPEPEAKKQKPSPQMKPPAPPMVNATKNTTVRHSKAQKEPKSQSQKPSHHSQIMLELRSSHTDQSQSAEAGMNPQSQSQRKQPSTPKPPAKTQKPKQPAKISPNSKKISKLSKNK